MLILILTTDFFAEAIVSTSSDCKFTMLDFFMSLTWLPIVDSIEFHMFFMVVLVIHQTILLPKSTRKILKTTSKVMCFFSMSIKEQYNKY